MYKVKVCGITDLSIVPVLNEMKPDYAGFIMTAGYKRSVEENFVAQCARSLPPSVARVGVFVDDDILRIARLVREGVITVVQLHGGEDGEYIARLKSLSPAPVIKAVGVHGGVAESYPGECDIVLLDACRGSARGGTGRKIEWRRYTEINKPVMLAGGITPQNVGEALRAVRPYGVDSSGGLETDGKKDAAKIRDYIKKVRSARL